MKKKYLVYLAVIFIVLAIVAALGFAVLRTRVPNIESPIPTTVCFAHVQKSGDLVDKDVLKLTITGDKATGFFNMIPAEKDQKVGLFTGVMDRPNVIGLIDSRIAGGLATLWWRTRAEGVTNTEELRIHIEDPGTGQPTATIGFGEMKDRGDGVYVYANPDAIQYNLELTEADCGTLDDLIPTLLHQEAVVTPTDYTQPLTTTYVTAASVWPPKVTTTNKIFSCTDTQKNIQGNMYCIKKDAEGAAGSTYTTYTYKTKVGDQLATTTFTLRTVQCMNYDEPQQSDCRNEQSNFDVDMFADGLIHQLVK